MKQLEKLQKQFHALTAKADSLPVDAVDEEAIRIDLILRYKERCKRDARNYAKKGCYVDGRAPKKSAVQNYKKTKEYQRRYDEALARSSRYAEIMSDTIDDNPSFQEELQKLIGRARNEARREARKDYARQIRKIAKRYMSSIPMEEYCAGHREEILQKERSMADAYIRSERMYITVRRSGEAGRGRAPEGVSKYSIVTSFNVITAEARR